MCGGCNYARFCSTQCINAAKPVHGLECKTLSRFHELKLSGESTPIRLLVRLLYTRFRESLEAKQEATGVKGRLRERLKARTTSATKSILDFSDVTDLVSHEVFCCMLYSVYCLLFVVLLFVICFVVCYLFCCLLFVVCCMLYSVYCCLLFVACCIVYVCMIL